MGQARAKFKLPPVFRFPQLPLLERTSREPGTLSLAACFRLSYQMNLFPTRLDEQQRRWYVALETKKLGHGGMTLLSGHRIQIDGVSFGTLSG
jgi:hypothetical protein